MCLNPFMATDRNKDKIPVPCGKCPLCLKRRASAWSFRLMQEEKKSESAHFITMTYDTKHVPITRNGFMELKKRDVQLFFKRLRKQHSSRIKYYAVGEYGGKTMRPHYHLILFNARIDLIQPAWDLGEIHYGEVTGASVGYTLKYMTKPSRIPLHHNDDRQREFSLMSKGLGISYLTEEMIRWHREDIDNRMYCNIEDGKKIAMPRYFKNKIYEEDERILIGKKLHDKRLEEMAKDPMDPRAKQQAIYAAFNKMYLDSQKGRNKI